MPISYTNKSIIPKPFIVTNKLDGETQEEYLERMLEMKKAYVGTGIRTMLPPKLEKPEVEELPQRS